MDQEEYFENWVIQLRRGLLDHCVLSSLGSGERYGYDLVKTLTALPGLDVSEGTLYPLLSRLRLQGLITSRLVESSEGPARKYYSLTARGRRVLAMMDKHTDLIARQRAKLHDMRNDT